MGLKNVYINPRFLYDSFDPSTAGVPRDRFKRLGITNKQLLSTPT